MRRVHLDRCLREAQWKFELAIQAPFFLVEIDAMEIASRTSLKGDEGKTGYKSRWKISIPRTSGS
jgi:hypothetical protein